MTIGEKINTLTLEYQSLYINLCHDKIEDISSRAANLALHDLVIQKYIYSEVYENVKRYIEDHPIEAVRDGVT